MTSRFAMNPGEVSGGLSAAEASGASGAAQAGSTSGGVLPVGYAMPFAGLVRAAMAAGQARALGDTVVNGVRRGVSANAVELVETANSTVLSC